MSENIISTIPVNDKEVAAKRVGVLNIKRLAYGQPRPYADSEYRWELTTKEDIDEAELLAFCQRFLRKNTQTYDEWKQGHNNSATIHFRGYHTLTKKDDQTWIYKILEPFCD